MSNLTLGSLFDGSGGFPLAGMMAGITPIWASEIEPFPIRVTTKRIPHMKHYGDISKMNGGKIEPVDIITFGSPCQNLSFMTPVLGAKIGGIPELIDDGKTGILFESGNLKELTEKIEYLYNNKELCRQMSENCRDIKYDTIKEYSEKLIKLYKEVIK